MAKNRAQERQVIAERRREVARLRLSGVRRQQDIADQLGVSIGTINGDFRAIDKQWAAETTMDTDAVKRLDLARIEAMLVVMWPLAMNAKTYAIDRIVMLMQHKAKLLGLEAPQKREVSGTINVRQVAEEIAEEFGVAPEDVIAEAEAIVRSVAK